MKYSLSIAPCLLSLLMFFSCVNEEVELPTINSLDVIHQGSDLYKQLQGISKNEEDPENEEFGIECIDFIYPFLIYVLDENLSIVRSDLINGDVKFSSLLNSVEAGYSISVSFPISAVLDNGDTFRIETIIDLKKSIDNCVKDEEEVSECKGIIEKCVWEVGYLDGQENNYLGATIQESSGQIVLAHKGNDYIGSWIPFSLNHELHLNIYFQDVNDSGVSDYFNFDWKVAYLDSDKVVLKYEDKTLLLNNRCDEDYANCTNFNFEECELTDTPGVAEFILNNYTPCILDILRLNENTKVSYYITNDDAVAEDNEIPSDQEFVTTSATQVIHAKVENGEGTSSIIIEITLIAKSC